jgi:hypothetical protein
MTGIGLLTFGICVLCIRAVQQVTVAFLKRRRADLYRDLAALAVSIVLASRPNTVLAQTGAISGTVWSRSTSGPIGGSLVRLPAEGREVRTDSLGRFRLERLRTGAHELQVLAVGYAPLITTVSLTADSTLAVDIDLEPVASTLARVVTTADRVDARNMNYGDFERRRATGMGRFISRAELLRDTGRSLASVLRSRIPGTRVWDVRSLQVLGASRGRISVQRGDAQCFVQVIIDNVVRYTTGGSLPLFDLRSLDPSMIAAIEFYTVATTPSEFNRGGNAPCGTLLIWLQN